MNIEKTDKNHLILKDSIASAVFDIWQETDKESQLKVSGYSMSPLIKNGDWVMLKHNSNDIRVGSIIAFRRERKIIVHRVIKIQNKFEKNSFITKGDFNYHADQAVDVENVIGKVIAIKKRRQFFQLDTKSWHVIGYIIATNPFILKNTYRVMRYFKRKLLRLRHYVYCPKT